MKDVLDLFSFGTLMDTELLEFVCQQDLTTLKLEPAVVQNQSRRWVLGDHYPVLVAEQGSETQGLIIRGLKAEALNRIMFFEGEEFNLKSMEVHLFDGAPEMVNYFADAKRKQVSDTEWSLSEWQQSTKAETMIRVVRYMGCFGKMSAAEADAYW